MASKTEYLVRIIGGPANLITEGYSIEDVIKLMAEDSRWNDAKYEVHKPHAEWEWPTPLYKNY